MAVAVVEKWPLWRVRDGPLFPYCRKFKQEVLVEWRELERDKNNNNNNNNKRDEFRWKNNMDILYKRTGPQATKFSCEQNKT